MNPSKYESLRISNSRRLLEIIAVIFTGIGKFIFMDWLQLRLLYVTFICAIWIGYIFFRFRENKLIIQYWGVSKHQFIKTFYELFPVCGIIIILFVLVGNYLGTSVLSTHIIPVLIIYPVWGIIQQFVMIAIIAQNLRGFQGIHMPDNLVIFITGSLFSIVHFPDLYLVIGTFFMAVVYTFLFIKGRNILAMGIFHGWMGAFFFYTILQSDKWVEVFGILQ